MRLLIEPGLPLDAIQGEVESAIAALEVAGDDRGLARAWRLLGYESFMRCRIERAEAALARTIEHARRAADERVDAYARGMLAAAAFWGPLPVAEGVARCRRLLEEAAGNRYVEGSVLHILGALAAMQGRFDQARDLVDQGAEVAAALGRLRLAAIWSQFAATVESLAGRPEAASERLARGYRALERMGETGARSNLAADLAHSMALGGRPDEARRYAEESRALAAREDVYAQVRWRAAAARALAAAGDGDHDRAVRLAREAVALAEATDMLNLQADALVDLAETAARSGRPEEAAEAAGRSLPLYERKGNQVAAASARVRLGLAAPPQAGGSAG
jgi:tetratricopeptide (TPR) repeat protein